MKAGNGIFNPGNAGNRILAPGNGIINAGNGKKLVTPVHHGETLASFKLFAQPMDRAEVLHAQSYDISGSWKNTPGENDQVLS